VVPSGGGKVGKTANMCKKGGETRQTTDSEEITAGLRARKTKRRGGGTDLECEKFPYGGR